jgi:hypothetical protein
MYSLVNYSIIVYKLIKFNLWLVLSSRHISMTHGYNQENSQQFTTIHNNSQQLGCNKQLRTDGSKIFKNRLLYFLINHGISLSNPRQFPPT